MHSRIPTVTIGLPVYNGESTLSAALDALLAQTFTDFEIVVSDNASSDGTAAICAINAARDARIRYIRQSVNLGASANFKFVLDQARGRFFMWAAADDLRSPDFVEENLNFLESHPEYVASTSPNCREGQDPNGPGRITFGLEGDAAARLQAFFDNCWISHGIFYSLIRTEILKACDLVGQSFLGADWAINLFLARQGPIHRTDKGLIVFGTRGLSKDRNAWRAFRTSPIAWFVPFYRVSWCTWRLSVGLSVRERWGLLRRLVRLNLYAARNQLYAEFHPFYHTHLRPLRQKLRRSS